MKTIKLILSAGVAGGLFAGMVALADDAPVTNKPAAPAAAAKTPPAPAAVPAPETPPAPDDQAASVTDTNVVVDPATGELKLRMQFQNAPLKTVLDYMSQAAGYIIVPETDISGKVTVWSDQPLNKEDALKLVKQLLNQHGYTAIVDGRTLTIYSSDKARILDIPVILGNIATNIPKDTEIVTQIIPVRSLNAVALLKDLQPLLPAQTTLTANESGNALIMTDTQANIHRIVEIVRALDSVSSSSSTIIVFPLKYADAKSVASLIKDLFPSASATTGNTGGPSGFGGFGRFFRGGGAPGGGENGGGTDTGNGHTPTSRVTAVSDDHANALVVSAPDDLVPTIKELVNSLDTDVQDTTEMRVFNLKHADPIEMATELSQLFPDDTSNNDNSQFSARYRFGFFGAPQQPAASSGESDRVKRLNRVLAVPDPRTRSLLVTASKDMMPQIAVMIERLDNDTRNIQHMYVYTLANAEVTDVLPVIQDLFNSGKTTGSSTSINTPQNSQLYLRTQTLGSSFNNQAASFGSTSGSGSRPAGQ